MVNAKVHVMLHLDSYKITWLPRTRQTITSMNRQYDDEIIVIIDSISGLGPSVCSVVFHAVFLVWLVYNSIHAPLTYMECDVQSLEEGTTIQRLSLRSQGCQSASSCAGHSETKCSPQTPSWPRPGVSSECSFLKSLFWEIMSTRHR